MNFYEQTFIVKQDLPSVDISGLREKYSKIIKDNEGKIHKTEDWGLINFSRKIRNYNKGYYIHLKFEGNNKTLEEIKKKINIDENVLKYLLIKYKKLDLKNEYFKKNNNHINRN